MAHTVEGRDGQSVYGEVLENVRRRGKRRQSRNGLTYELEDVTIVLDSPENALPIHTGRQVSRKVAAVEALQLIGGFSDPEWAVKHAPGLQPYRDPDGSFYGAYGERIGTQLTSVYSKLTNEPLTRQAVMTLWNPEKDNEPHHRDYPCTIAIGFSLTGHALDRLNMRVQMRSNDAWMGLPYDMFQFGQLQLTLANIIGVTAGYYVHNAWSLHLYEENVAESYNVVEAPMAIVPQLRDRQPSGLGTAHDGPGSVQLQAISLAYAKSTEDLLNVSERWYYDALHG